MLARRSTTKIPARNEDARAFVTRLIQHELGVLLSVRAEPPVIKQELAKPRLLNPLQKLLGNNLVSIHVDSIKRRHAPAMHGEWFHFASLGFWVAQRFQRCDSDTAGDEGFSPWGNSRQSCEIL